MYFKIEKLNLLKYAAIAVNVAIVTGKLNRPTIRSSPVSTSVITHYPIGGATAGVQQCSIYSGSC